jgi:hypothetical protein
MASEPRASNEVVPGLLVVGMGVLYVSCGPLRPLVIRTVVPRGVRCWAGSRKRP